MEKLFVVEKLNSILYRCDNNKIYILEDDELTLTDFDNLKENRIQYIKRNGQNEIIIFVIY